MGECYPLSRPAIEEKPSKLRSPKEPLLPSGRSDLCISLDSNPLRFGGLKSEQVLRVQSFRTTVRALQLDHTSFSCRLLSWFLGLLLLFVIPFLRLYCLKVDVSITPNNYQMVSEPLVVVLGFAISSVSFLFLGETVRRHGFRGVLFLDVAEEESNEVRKDYHKVIENGWAQLVKMFVPIFIMYILVKAWFFENVTLEPLPLGFGSKPMVLIIIMILTTVSWVFQTTTFLYTCILFSTVCALQELKMKKYKELLSGGIDSEFYFEKYGKIIRGLRLTSRRFRLFLALAGALTLFGALASMYKVVEAERAQISFFMSGELVVLNIVNLIGVGLCLKSASKIAHLHRRIVKVACSMHAVETYESPSFNTLSVFGKEKQPSYSERLMTFCQIQDAWCRRAAFVDYLSYIGAGISVYGFVLDRFVVHTSIGAFVPTLWFILGRSLES